MNEPRLRSMRSSSLSPDLGFIETDGDLSLGEFAGERQRHLEVVLGVGRFLDHRDRARLTPARGRLRPAPPPAMLRWQTN